MTHLLGAPHKADGIQLTHLPGWQALVLLRWLLLGLL